MRHARWTIAFLTLALVGVLTAQNQEQHKCTLYIEAPPDAQAIKEEIRGKLLEWNGVSIVTLPANADLVLEVVQSGKLNVMTGSGDKGAAVLKDGHTGEDLWTDSRGGGWSMRGWSNRAVGRKLGAKLVEFLQSYVNRSRPPDNR